MSSIGKELEELLRAIRNSEFRENAKDAFEKEAAPKQPTEKGKSDAARSFVQNKNDITEDRRPPIEKDGYQEALDEIERRIKAAKGLSEKDMREIENALARQDIEKQIYMSRIKMQNDMNRQIAQWKSQYEEIKSRVEAEKPMTAKERFIATMMSKSKDHDRER